MRFQNNPFKHIGHLICLAALLMLASCSATKYIPAGDALYTGAAIKLKDSISSKKQKKSLTADLTKLPRPKPNGKLLGIPLKVMIYNMGGNPEKKSKIRNIFRKFGEPPVLLSSLNLEYNNKVIRNYLENVGYFKAEVSGDTVVKRKKAKAIYTVSPGHVYTIKEVQFVADSSAVLRAIKLTEPGSLLKRGDPFNLDVIKGERTRIDATLKEQGYYYFSPDLLIVDVDSTIGDNKVNMYVKLKTNTPAAGRKPYIIDDVFIYSNYRLNSARLDTLKTRDSSYNGYFIIDRAKRFKPKMFPRILRFDSGDVYNRRDHNLTLNRLINLDVFKFVKNRFEISPQNSHADTGRLNAFYYLTPQPKKSLRAELSGNTKSNNYVGSLVRFTFRNRNSFRGAEQLELHANVGSEVQYSGANSGFNSFRLGGGLAFSIPRFVVPFFKFNTTSAYVPRTRIGLDYELLNRQKLYTLTSVRGELGYVWKPELRKEHQLNPIAINYVWPLNITQIYRDSIEKDFTLRQAVDTQFILGSDYTYTFDQLVNNPRGSGFFFSGNIDLSGNILGLAMGANVKDGKQKRIFDAPFSQYIKTQADFRYYYAVNEKLRWANRIILGLGYPYGNSRQMPFVKQFFIGGNNSIRAFRSRSLGPGTYINSRFLEDSSNNFLPDQSGDIKIELNTELRYKFTPIIEGALFVDAGNIWLYNENPDKPGGKFSKNFLKEFAVGAGAGVRLDLTILLLRIDAAVPLRKPYLPQGQQVVKDFNTSNIVYNIGIGYPF